MSPKYLSIQQAMNEGSGPVSVRGWNWIKWKKEYAKDMADTLDLGIW